MLVHANVYLYIFTMTPPKSQPSQKTCPPGGGTVRQDHLYMVYDTCTCYLYLAINLLVHTQFEIGEA